MQQKHYQRATLCRSSQPQNSFFLSQQKQIAFESLRFILMASSMRPRAIKHPTRVKSMCIVFMELMLMLKGNFKLFLLQKENKFINEIHHIVSTCSYKEKDLLFMSMQFNKFCILCRELNRILLNLFHIRRYARLEKEVIDLLQ